MHGYMYLFYSSHPEKRRYFIIWAFAVMSGRVGIHLANGIAVVSIHVTLKHACTCMKVCMSITKKKCITNKILMNFSPNFCPALLSVCRKLLSSVRMRLITIPPTSDMEFFNSSFRVIFCSKQVSQNPVLK